MRTAWTVNVEVKFLSSNLFVRNYGKNNYCQFSYRFQPILNSFILLQMHGNL